MLKIFHESDSYYFRLFVNMASCHCIRLLLCTKDIKAEIISVVEVSQWNLNFLHMRTRISPEEKSLKHEMLSHGRWYHSIFMSSKWKCNMHFSPKSFVSDHFYYISKGQLSLQPRIPKTCNIIWVKMMTNAARSVLLGFCNFCIMP